MVDNEKIDSQSSCLSFVADPAPTPPSVLAQEASDSTCRSLKVDLIITDVSDVFATSFSLVFDGAIARLEDVSTTTSFLGSDGATLEVVTTPGPDGVQIGITRLGVATGVDASGPQILARLRFAALLPAGATGVSFEDTRILDSETPPQEKSGIVWTGGVLEVLLQ